MKIKFRTADGTILAMGFMPDLAAGPGETVEDYSGEILNVQQLRYFQHTGKDSLKEKSEGEKAAADTAANASTDALREKLKASLSISDKEAEMLVK